MKKTDKWSEYWQNESDSGEVFVDKNGDKHQALSAFWKTCLENQPAGNKIIDLACGAGSIFADLPASQHYELYAADLSPDALKHLKQRLPEVHTHVCSADDLPFEDDFFDVVVSQFGIEYAGQGGFLEAARIVKSGGCLHVLCHIENGYIDSNNRNELDGAKLVKELAFIEKAIAVTSASYATDNATMKNAFEAFVAVEPLLAKQVNTSERGVHHHLYHGFKSLFVNKSAYTEQDILSWLQDMQNQIDESILRLTEMRKAACSESDMQQIIEQFAVLGMSLVKCEPFMLPEQTLPVAWYLSSVKKTKI